MDDLPAYPITNKERYLAKAAGQEAELPPYPITREERYLNKIAEGGGGGGTKNYNELNNKPSINSITLQGNKDAHDLNLAGLDANTFTQTQKVNSAAYAGMKLQDADAPQTIFTDFGKTGMFISDGDGSTTIAYKDIATKNNTALTGNTTAENIAVSTSITVPTPTGNTNATTKAYVDAADSALDTRITNLQNIGRFLAIWDCTTGLPTSNPTTLPYAYKTGDYYRVGNVDATTNYMPTGATYTGTASTTTYTGSGLGVGAVFYYDGTNWLLQASGGGGTVQDVQVNGTSVLSGGIANVLVPSVVQSVGTSTTDVMSQNAASRLVYGYNSYSGTLYSDQIKVGNNGTQGSDSINVGFGPADVQKTGGSAIRISYSQHPSIMGTHDIYIGGGITNPVTGYFMNNNRGIIIGIGLGKMANGADGSIRIGTISGDVNYKGCINLGDFTPAPTANGQMNIGTTVTTVGYNSSNYRLLTGLYDGQSAHDAATVGQAVGDTETYTIATTDWTALASSAPYTYSATVTATHTIGNNTIVELYNDNPVLFAANGFAVGSVSGQSVTIYSIGTPSASVSLKVNYKG